ncbi:hypothetical protein VKT23_018341 [Stygiomarasmius scandens]|uniref:HET-domain-containing protein n=1 Tax=Marasmiellus scandens TaxID=2682957 RepID=A0ABR1IPK3_9AGAR
MSSRPLRLINTQTLKLEDFSGLYYTIPPYAILSHQWHLDEEVSFREYLKFRDETRRKAGYRKILQACKQARRDNLGHIWIDTCCIDKDNHKEVAWNVKSMYAYYENSEVCYAYLVDVSRPRHAGGTLPWKKSRWFKRGWTLQELVAPRRVVFFNSQWISFGDKQTLKVDIHHLTGIPSSVLEGSKLIWEVDIWDRMSWCAGRKTTKPADLVYCLLGLLGVDMEPDYTESVTDAFQRLQSALIETYPETFKTLEDAQDIYRTLIHQSVRTRLGIDEPDEEMCSIYDSFSLKPASTSLVAPSLHLPIKKSLLLARRMVTYIRNLLRSTSSRSSDSRHVVPASLASTYSPTYSPMELQTGFVRFNAEDSFLPPPVYISTPAPPLSMTVSTASNTKPFGFTTPRGTCSTTSASRLASNPTDAWHRNPNRPRPHVSFVNLNRSQTLRMHPLFATGPHTRAPISYDVMYRPTPQTVLDRITHSAIPSNTLSQPATDPPTFGTLVLNSDRFPWPIIVRPAAASATGSTKFYFGGSSQSVPVTNNDLILTLYSALSSRVTREEWDALGKGSRAQRKVTRAYERRTRALGDKAGGVRRIDWLGKKTWLIGIEVDKTAIDTSVAKLIFGKPMGNLEVLT